MPVHKNIKVPLILGQPFYFFDVIVDNVNQSLLNLSSGITCSEYTPCFVHVHGHEKKVWNKGEKKLQIQTSRIGIGDVIKKKKTKKKLHTWIPEEVRRAYVSAYGLYREAFQEGWWQIYAPIESFISLKSIGAINPIQFLWFDFNIHDPLKTSSCDKWLTGKMEELRYPGTIKWLKMNLWSTQRVLQYFASCSMID